MHRAAGTRRVLSHAPRETTRSLARRPQRNTRFLACSREIARRHRRCPLTTRDGTDLTTRFAEVTVASMRSPWRWYAKAHKVCAVSSAKCSGGLCDVAGRAVCCPGSLDPPTLPAAPDPGDGRGTLFAPSAWVVLSTPVQKQIDLKVYGFYIGDLQVPVAQVDVPIRMAKFLTVTPSYMGYSVPASGLNEVHAAAGKLHGQLRGAPISSRRDRGVRRSQVRDLRPQHVCPKVSSDSIR